MKRKGLIEKIGIALLMVLLVCAPAMASHITEFNGEVADANDQVSHLVLPENADGNVSIQMNNNSVGWGNISDTLVISFNANASSYTVSKTGDTGNLTVTRNPLNITIKNTYSNVAGVDYVNMTFNYSKGLNTSEGIDTGSPSTSKDVLAWVSNNNGTTYNASNADTERQTMTIYDPNDVYDFKTTVASVGGNFSKTIDDATNNFTIDLTDTSNDEVEFTHTVYRGAYDEDLVPLYKSYFHLNLKYPNFTNLLIESVDSNTTEIGKTLDDYYTAKFLDNDVSANNTVKVSAYAWDTNGTLKDGFKASYNINPTGGLTVSPENTKDVNVTKAAAAAAPTGLQYFLQYTVNIFGLEVPIIYLIGAVILASVVIVLAWRWSLGFPVLGRGGAASILTALMAFGLISFIQQVVSDTWSYVSSNPVLLAFAMIVVGLILVFSIYGMYKFATRY